MNDITGGDIGHDEAAMRHLSARWLGNHAAYRICVRCHLDLSRTENKNWKGVGHPSLSCLLTSAVRLHKRRKLANAAATRSRKRAVKLGDFTALTLPTEGAYFHRKVAGGASLGARVALQPKPDVSCSSRRRKNPSGPNGP